MVGHPYGLPHVSLQFASISAVCLRLTFKDCVLTEILYTCQLFLRYRREIFILGVLRVVRTTRLFPKIPDEVGSLPKNPEVFRKCPKSQSQHKHELAPSAFYFKNQRSRERYCHLLILHMIFVPYMGLS